MDSRLTDTPARKAQVQRFYELLWNAHDLAAMPSILHEDFAFRGSLGEEKSGHRGFAEYVDTVHSALEEYRCAIELLVEEGDSVFAKVRFGDFHKGLLMGFKPTGKLVQWDGCALFTFRGEKVCKLWVLGHLKGLEQQLSGE